LTPSLGVIGAAGRLGRCICALADQLGWPVRLRAGRQGWQIEAAPQVLIDVSHPSALPEVVAYCGREGVALVEGTSGLDAEHREALVRLGERVGVVLAPNFAFGHFLQRALLEHLAALVALQPFPLTSEFTVQERHPAHKKDRPSATALELARLWYTHAGRPVADVASIRAGLPVSDHEVTLTLAGELLGIKHSVTDRLAAARGALHAAGWLAQRGPGLWDMSHAYQAPTNE
jgi:4-hydroxy-tetrahydrodipicolinate reductase